MRQGNGTELLGMNDPRSATIGIIYVSPNDDRKSVLAAILTQEKLGRKDIVIDLSAGNKAFQSAQDFEDLKSVNRKLQARIIFITSDASADYARQRQFPVFPTLDSYTQSLNENNAGEKKEAAGGGLLGIFRGRKSKPLNAGAVAAGGALAGAAAAAGLSNSQHGNAGESSQPANAAGAQPDAIAGGPGGTQTSGSEVAQAATPSTANTIDDDDALDDTPSLSVRHGAGTMGAAAAGAGAGFLVGETLRRNQANPAVDSAGPTPLKSAPVVPDTPAASATTPAAQSASAQTTPAIDATDAAGESSSGPGIIELRPRPVRRNSANLQDGGAQTVEPPASRGAPRRRNGGAAAAGLAGGLALGAAAAANAGAAGASTAASGAASSATAASGTARAAGGGPPQRGTPPGRGGRGNTPPRRGRILLLLLLLLLLTAVVSGIVYASINPGGLPAAITRPFSNLVPAALQPNPATITIVPDSKEVQDSYIMQAVASQPNADQLQVAMRDLSAAPDAQTKAVTGTGTGHTDPVAARGRLTFINGSFGVYTVASGTVISASNGVSVVTEQPAVIPANTPGGTNGTVTVPAHAVTAGTAGNLDQLAINKTCCSAGNAIFVRNDAAFSGGVDPKTYTFVQRADVNAAATPLEETLSQQASAQFKQQLKPNEKLVGEPTCNSNVAVDQATVGDKGHNIASTTISVTAKCTGVAYDQGAAQAIAKERLQKKADIDPGKGYTLVGNIVTDVSISKVNQGSIALLVNARGIWAYQFDDAQKQALARQLAGKKVSQAQAYLNGQRGINNAKIEVRGDTLPTDPGQITFVIQQVPGENANGNNGNGNNATPNGAPTSEPGKGLVPGSDSVKG